MTEARTLDLRIHTLSTDKKLDRAIAFTRAIGWKNKLDFLSAIQPLLALTWGQTIGSRHDLHSGSSDQGCGIIS